MQSGNSSIWDCANFLGVLSREMSGLEEIEQTKAPRFNPLDFLRTDELGLSNIIRWMLDSRETHGQGHLFLREFLTSFGIDTNASTEGARAVTEAVTNLLDTPGRIDVLVEFGGFALAIENKPDAGWQKDQVRRYLEQLSLGHPAAGHHLAVIKGYAGDLPSDQLTQDEREYLINEGFLTDSDYTQLKDWVETCVEKSECEAVSHFLRHFVKYISKRFEGAGLSHMDREVLSLIESGGHRGAAYRLLDAKDAILNDLIKRFTSSLEGMKKPELPESARYSELSYAAADSGLNFEMSKEVPVIFRIEFQDRGLGEPLWGLAPRDGYLEKHPYPDLAQKVKSRYITYIPGDWWTCWQYVHQSPGIDLKPGDRVGVWLAIADGSLAKAVQEEFWRLRDFLSSIDAPNAAPEGH